MARRTTHPLVRRFELAAAAAAGVGLPLVFALPLSLKARFYALAALFPLALAVGAAAAWWKKRRDSASGREIFRGGEAALASDPDLVAPWRHLHPGADASQLDTGRWSPELLKRLEWRRFEELCAAYFDALGFVTEMNGFGSDGGIDIRLYSENSPGPAILVQCKAWNVYNVGIRPVRELLGAMTEAGVAEGCFVTSARFTVEARALAEKNNIILIDGQDLLAKIADLAPEKSAALLARAVAGDFITPTCPSCGVKMTARSSTQYGRRYWGCPNYPRCSQTFFGTANAPA